MNANDYTLSIRSVTLSATLAGRRVLRANRPSDTTDTVHTRPHRGREKMTHDAK
jgi:hypothetical protein